METALTLGGFGLPAFMGGFCGDSFAGSTRMSPRSFVRRGVVDGSSSVAHRPMVALPGVEACRVGSCWEDFCRVLVLALLASCWVL